MGVEIDRDSFAGEDYAQFTHRLPSAAEVDELLTRMTFGHARRNFYAAAEHGPDAELVWARADAPSPRSVGAAPLVQELVPVARRGLLGAGVDAYEADELLAVV